MLNTKQRDTIEKISINLVTVSMASLVLGSFITNRDFRLNIFFSGIILVILFLGLALWIHRKENN